MDVMLEARIPATVDLRDGSTGIGDLEVRVTDPGQLEDVYAGPAGPRGGLRQ